MLHSKDITVGLVCSVAGAAPANSRILHAIISQDSFVAAGPAEPLEKEEPLRAVRQQMNESYDQQAIVKI